MLPEVVTESRTPVLTAVRLRKGRIALKGTVRAVEKVALSVGVLLLGNHVIAPTGSLSATAPPVVLVQPSIDPSGSVWAVGVPE